MDYSIGSLSDLITGSDTPNKKKIKKVKKESISTDAWETYAMETSAISSDAEEQSSEPRPKKKGKKAKLVKKENGSSEEAPKTGKVPEDENAEKPKKAKKRKLAEQAEGNEVGVTIKKHVESAEEKEDRDEEDPEKLARTVFVGNLPLTLTTQKLKRMFAKYGKIDSVRIRGAPVANPKTPRKVAFIKKQFHPDRKSFYGFVRFEERDDAIKATAANGVVFQDHHLRVHLCDAKDKPDQNKAIFVGNLSFYAEEEDLWKTFESCGTIESVRIVRDGMTGMGKGFGYVNFQNSDSVTLAMEMENVKLKDRELRISACNNNAAKKNRKKRITRAGKLRGPKKEKAEGDEETEEIGEKKTGNKSFQGAKFIQKKKKKFDKGLLEKKKKVKQLAPK